MDKATSKLIAAINTEAGLDPVEPHEDTMLVLGGPYNTGKTTLIKRLLTEQQLPIPDWISIGGAPETTTADSVRLDGDHFIVDTPGLDSGSESHRKSAYQAIEAADVLILMLHSANPLTSKDEVIDLIAGRHVHPNGWPWPENSIQIILTRLDLGGLDPGADTADFMGLAADKERQLTSALQQALAASGVTPTPNVPPIHVVTADAFEGVSNGSDLSYERGEWDGISALLEVIAALPDASLREAAAIRQTVSAAAESATASGLAAQALLLDGEPFKTRADDLEAALQFQKREIEARVVDLTVKLDLFVSKLSATDDVQGIEAKLRRIGTEWLDDQQKWLDDGIPGFEDELFTVDDGKIKASGAPWGLLQTFADNADPTAKKAEKVAETLLRKSKIDILKEIQDAKEKGDDYFTDAKRMFPNKGALKGAEVFFVVADVAPILGELAQLVSDARGSGVPEHEKALMKLRKIVREYCDEIAATGEEMLEEAFDASTVSMKEEIAMQRAHFEAASEAASEASEQAKKIEGLIAELRESIST